MFADLTAASTCNAPAHAGTSRPHSVRVHYQAGWSLVVEELLDAFEGIDVELALDEDWSRVFNVRFKLPEQIDPADKVKVW